MNSFLKYMDKSKRLYVLIAVLLVFVLGAVFINRASLYDVLTQKKLVPLPETFTELYFANHNQLPHLLKNNEVAHFAFTIHNEENKTVTYPYTVDYVTEDKTYLIETNYITLINNEYKTIEENFQVSSPPQRSKVVVTLRNKQQSISFWLSKAL